MANHWMRKLILTSFAVALAAAVSVNQAWGKKAEPKKTNTVAAEAELDNEPVMKDDSYTPELRAQFEKLAKSGEKRKIAGFEGAKEVHDVNSFEKDHLCLNVLIAGVNANSENAGEIRKLCASHALVNWILKLSDDALQANKIGQQGAKLSLRSLEGVKSVVDLDALVHAAHTLVMMDQKLEPVKSLSPGARLLVANLQLLKPLRSLVFRARLLVEDVKMNPEYRSVHISNKELYDSEGQLIGANKITETGDTKHKWASAYKAMFSPKPKNSPAFSHTTVVTFLRTVATGVAAFLPTEEWKAGFGYVVTPLNQMGHELNDELDYRRWLRNDWRAALLLAKAQANKAAAEMMSGGKNKFYWDNRILYSQSNFLNQEDRYLLMGVSEIQLYLAGLNMTLAAAEMGYSYRVTGIIDFMDEVARMYGFMNTFDNVNGLAAKARFDLLKKKGVPWEQMFTLVPNHMMKDALSNIVDAVDLSNKAWAILQKDETNPEALANNFIDPRVVAPFNRIIDSNFKIFDKLLGKSKDGPVAIVTSDIVHGESVKVAFLEFFNNPPADLKDFAPVFFEQQNCDKRITNKKLVSIVDSSGAANPRVFRNYRYDSPKAWKFEVWNKYFPDLAVANASEICPDASKSDLQAAGALTGDVKRQARILSQTWGGWVVAPAVAAWLF